MVVSLVLELEKPLLCCHLALVVNDVNVYIDAACVVLLADLHVIKVAVCLEVTCTDAGHIHEVETLVLTAEFLADLHVKIESAVDLVLKERLLDIDVLKLSCERCMTAVVAPVCIEDAKLCLERITALSLEVVHYLTKVVCVHCKTHLLAVRCELLLCESCKTFKYRDRCNLRLLHCRKLSKILLARLHCVDVIFLDLCDHFFCCVCREDDELGALDAHLCSRVDKTDTVNS